MLLRLLLREELQCSHIGKLVLYTSLAARLLWLTLAMMSAQPCHAAAA